MKKGFSGKTILLLLAILDILSSFNEICMTLFVHKEADLFLILSEVFCLLGGILIVMTLTNHGYLKEAYVIDEISRFSRKAKRKLEEAKKIYDTDVSFNSIRITDGHYDLTHNLENIVFNELLYRDYQLTVYDNNGKEVDFLAEKDNKKYYVQVAYSVLEKKTYDREFSAFNHLSQVDMKILITNDELDYSTSNVKHIRLKEFLRNGLD